MSDISHETQPQQEPLPWIAKLIGIFTNPRLVFESMRVHVSLDWLIPALLIIIVNTIGGIMTSDISMEFQEKLIMNSERIPEEMKDEMLDDARNQSTAGMIVKLSLTFLFVYVAIPFAVVGGLLLTFGNFVFGGSASFKEMVALYSWGSMIGVLGSIVKYILVLAKGSVEVYTGLALFFDPASKGTLWFQFFSAFDLFMIWEWIVVAIGFSVIYKLDAWKGYVSVGLIYLAIALIKAVQMMLMYSMM